MRQMRNFSQERRADNLAGILKYLEDARLICEAGSGFGEGMVFSSDGKRLMTGGEENTVKIWDSGNGELLQTLRGHTGGVWALAIDQEERWLATAGEDTTIRIWNPDSGRLLHTLRGHINVITSLAFSSDGQLLASGSRDHTVKLWNTASWRDSR